MVQWVGRRQLGGPGDKGFVVRSRTVTGTVRPASYTPESDHLQPPTASTRAARAVVAAKAAAAAKSQAAAKFQVTAKAEAAAKGPAATSGNVPPRDSARRAGRGPVSAKQKGFQEAATSTAADPLVLGHSRGSSVHALIPEAGLNGAKGGSALATGSRHTKSKGKGHDARTVRVTLTAIASNTWVIGKKGCRGNSVNRARQCEHGSRKTRCPICALTSNGGTGSLCVHFKQKGWCLECKKDGRTYYGDRCSKDS